MKFLLFPLLFFVQSISAQIEFSLTEFDLGKISKLNEDIVDVYIQNTTKNLIKIEGVELSPNVTVNKTSNVFPPNQPQIIRVKLNPTEIGKFTKKITLYVSSNSEPIVLTFTGNLRAKPKNNSTACPDFSSPKKAAANFKGKFGQSKQTFVEIKEIEENHSEVLAENIESNLEVEEDVNKILAEKSEPKLEEKEEESLTLDNNQERGTSRTKVKKTPEERRNSPSILTTLFGNEDEPNDSIQEKTEQVDNFEEEETIEVVERPSINDPDSEEKQNINLLSADFKPNNIIFLIDASTSMREEERMDILKTAMIQLLEPLRSIDYLSIVTYSGEAKILLPPTSGVEKELIKASIENIVADGSTNAPKGIKKAIQVGKANFLKEGNNQIILATDGAFDIGSKNEALRRKIKNTSEEGLTVTVLGIKNDKWTNKSLKEIVELGNGDFIRLSGYRDAAKILEEVKRKSKN